MSNKMCPFYIFQIDYNIILRNNNDKILSFYK